MARQIDVIAQARIKPMTQTRRSFPVTRASGPCEVRSIFGQSAFSNEPNTMHGPEARVTVEFLYQPAPALGSSCPGTFSQARRSCAESDRLRRSTAAARGEAA